MKICIFAKGLPVHIWGGMEIHTYTLARELVKRGHDVTIITTKHPRGINVEKKDGIKIHYIGNKSLKYNKDFFVESAKIFKTLDNIENFDIVHSQSVAGFGFVKYCKTEKPLITTMHGIMKNEIRSIFNEGVKKWPIAFLLSFKYPEIKRRDAMLLRRSKKIIADSFELKDDLNKVYGVSKNKIEIVYDGINVRKFKPRKVEDKRYGFQEDEKIIMSSGRLVKQKGYHLLIKILPELLKEIKVRLIVVGEGEYLKALKKLAEKKGVSDNVIFTGRVSEEELINYYNLADVFAFPTLRVEAFGIVIAEAMACETPVIATRIGGIPTVVDDGKNGFLIKKGNLKELKDRILTILNDEKLAKKMGRAGRKKVIEKFSLEKMIEDTIKVYEEAINSNGR